MSIKCKSLAELMNDAFNLSLDLAYSELSPDGHYFTARNLPVTKDVDDMIFCWCDGLKHKYYENVSTGRCSLQRMIDFEIELMTELLRKFGGPITLTFEEMRKRGYRGKWAGYTEKEDNEFYLDKFTKELVLAEQELKEEEKKKQCNWDSIYYFKQTVTDLKRLIKEYENKFKT